MSEETRTNNPQVDPDEGQSTGTGTDVDYDKLPMEELEKLAKATEGNEEPEEISEETEEEPEETEQTEEKAEDETKISEDLLKKSPEELAKMYTNLQKKLGEHSNELGELRKFREEQEKLKKVVEGYQLSATNQHIVNNFIDKMSPEQTTQFLDDFASNPKKALLPIITEAMKPYTMTQAKYNNMMAVQNLKEKTKDELIPYEKYEKEINEILAKRDENGRNQLWDRFGSGAFEEAYNIVYRKHAPEEIARIKREAEEAKKEAENQLKRKKTYTEKQELSSVAKGGKVTDYNKMPLEQLEKLVGKPDDTGPDIR